MKETKYKLMSNANDNKTRNQNFSTISNVSQSVSV